MPPAVFITGASSGIGEALAVYYAAQGARLGLVSRRAEALAALNQRLGGGHACYALDVADAGALEAAARDFIGRWGAPDIVIANAGVSAGTLTEHPEDLAAFRRILDINVYGMAATFAPFIGPMRQAGGSRRLVGIVHADVPMGDWNKFMVLLSSVGSLASAAANHAQWSRARIDAHLDGLPTEPVAGVRAVVVGHTPLPSVTVAANVHHIDTMGWRQPGRFTLLDAETLRPITPASLGS